VSFFLRQKKVGKKEPRKQPKIMSLQNQASAETLVVLPDASSEIDSAEQQQLETMQDEKDSDKDWNHLLRKLDVRYGLWGCYVRNLKNHQLTLV
jgi:hypothetical protein